MFQNQAQRNVVLLLCFIIMLLRHVCCEDAILAEMIQINVSPALELGGNATIECLTKIKQTDIWWSFNNQNITEFDRFVPEFTYSEDTVESIAVLNIVSLMTADHGNYTCHVLNEFNAMERTILLDLSIPLTIRDWSKTKRLKVNEEYTCFCLFEGFPMTNFHWQKGNDSSTAIELNYRSNLHVLNDTHTNMTLTISGIARKDNGTYYCFAEGSQGMINASINILVLDIPQINIEFVKAVGADKLFLNWTVNDGNDPVKEYFIKYMENGTNSWTFYNDRIGGGNVSYVLKNFKPRTAYQLELMGKNDHGVGEFKYSHWVKTLDRDPKFVPKLEVKGNTLNTITIGWTPPPIDLLGHVQYYELVAQEYNSTDKKEVLQPEDSINLPYMFENLKIATMYTFKARACSDYTKQCGDWSSLVNGTTMDGISSSPQNLSVVCRFDNISRISFVFVTWEPPVSRNGKITHYNVVLVGHARYITAKGTQNDETWGPKVKSVSETAYSARYDMVPPNTNYTISVSGVTRTKKAGNQTSKTCSMPPTIPNKDQLRRFSWGKVMEQGNWMFKLNLPRVSERNGAICCYRIFMVRMEAHQTVSALPSPENLPLSSYHAVHKSLIGGAYVAEIFASDTLHSEVFLGDGHSFNTSSVCQECIVLKPSSNPTDQMTAIHKEHQHLTKITSLMTSPGLAKQHSTFSPTRPANISQLNSLQRLKRNSPHVSSIDSAQSDPMSVYDGQLDNMSNYTGFIEIIVYGTTKGQLLPAYSDYFVLMSPGPEPDSASGFSDILGVVVQVFCGLMLIILVLLATLCLVHRYTIKIAQAQGIEMMTIRNSFSLMSRHLCRSFRGHQLVSYSPPNMGPISKHDLFDAFVVRHRDSDYGFQHEFEMLPDCFMDRTTLSSEARENAFKNRYPDIKAYDQTRVRLAQINSIAGSDYINANFVLGYKERKKFICAQGPMDNTVNDYWRMIWEQHLELILMLTNLEEYNKTKCAKYWPDTVNCDKEFGDITVTHLKEKSYADYIVRHLKVTKKVIGHGTEERNIFQYHFLVWKDFMAPEYPQGIIKFIKRVNEVYSLERGPILVHCSAGVGRTGTLVALDYLLQQLNEEGQVSIFNTVCDLRHQRNFLVQSLKQYIFVYRALLEVAQYGDTEIAAEKLKSTVDHLRTREVDKDKNKMEEDFDVIKSIMEDEKTFIVGSGEENREKNRNEHVIPYDRNRVILTPVPEMDHSTYINASFVEGYDNTESFIITQDPLEMTIPDFWRMVSEQSISTLVMLADLGEGPRKCPRYWPDDIILHNHIQVKYIQSESCPYYTRRELIVTNTKTEESIIVMQLHYHGWPTVEGEVPEVTRGIIELVDQALANRANAITSGPIAVHCSCGTERSSMFVALCILVQQLRTEKRVDIFTTTRKLRSQRRAMLNTFAQYEFLHRAIVNYSELHCLTESES